MDTADECGTFRNLKIILKYEPDFWGFTMFFITWPFFPMLQH